MASQTSLLGAAGEHHVMVELLRRGYIGALAPEGVPNTDILVSDLQGTRLCSIQVKSRRDIGSDGGWHMKAKHELLRASQFFYVFVNFGKSPNDRPLTHILPSVIVADALAASHQKWLTTPGKKAQARKDGPMRRLMPDYSRIFSPGLNPYPLGWLDKYRDSWHLLGLEAASIDEEPEVELAEPRLVQHRGRGVSKGDRVPSS